MQQKVPLGYAQPTQPLMPVVLASASPTMSTPLACGISAGAPPSDRDAQRQQLCEKAFRFVDALRTGYITSSQNKSGLTLVFDWLGDVPRPKDEWFARVFHNFAGDEQGLIDFPGFCDIVKQWDEYHSSKRQRHSEVGLPQHPADPPLPATSATVPTSELRQEYLDEGAPVEGAAPPPAFQSQEVSELPSSALAQSPVQWPLPPTATVSEVSYPSQTPKGSSPCRAAPPVPAVPADSFQLLRPQSVQPPAHAPPAEEAPTPEETLEPAESLQTAAGGQPPEDDLKSPEPPSLSLQVQIGGAASSSPGSPQRAAAASLSSELLYPTYIGRLAIFDDYEFFGDVGSGSFGKVMVVRHRLTKQLRACKVVAVQTALQRELVDTEISLLKSLNHPNIMKMHEVYFEQGEKNRIENGNIYLVTELCEGGDLFSRILHHYERLKQPMTESHVAYMMQQILSATQYCHDKGIIHRDIKPENILFVNRLSTSPLKIIDFGLANFTNRIKEQAKEVKVPRGGTLGRLARMLPSVKGKHLIPWHERKRVMQKAGTPHYMAPEMIEGSYDQKADLFSIGIIFCQLVTGWHPFYVPGDDEFAVRSKISSTEAVQFPKDLWASVSPEATDLCRKLLEKNPKHRCSAAQALAHPWFRDPSKATPFGNVQSLSVSIFDGLMKYQAYNKLKRAVLQLLTRELSEFQIQELRSKFMALDSRGDGLLCPQELLAGMRHVGYEMSDAELDKVVAALDGSGSQHIGYKEFISALIERRVTFDRLQLQQCFMKFDKRNTGRITYEDVKNVLTPAITESEWQEIANVGGKAHPSPELTFDEFVLLMEQTDNPT